MYLPLISTLPANQNILPVTLTAQVQPAKKEPKQYVIQENDTLTKIAEQNATTWQRLYAKNTNLSSPDILNVGYTITIPLTDEVLPERAIPQVAAETQSEPTRNRSVSVNGNDMDYGYCTWYVKENRPDLPTGLGNANTWYSRASAWGLPVGSTPRVGAVATTTRGYMGHVALVTQVDGNRIFVSEMNVQGRGVVSAAWYQASDYLYIY